MMLFALMQYKQTQYNQIFSYDTEYQGVYFGVHTKQSMYYNGKEQETYECED